jgi:hypothetical protein
MHMPARSALRCTVTLISPPAAVPATIAGDDGLEDWQHPPGRDPRRMTVAELTAMGRPPISRANAIRQNCLNCCCGSAAEVRRCHMLSCPMWPFRMGTDPYHVREVSAERRAALVATGQRLAARRQAKQPHGGAAAKHGD